MHCTLPQPLPSKGGELRIPSPLVGERVRERGHFADNKKLTGHHCIKLIFNP